ncbi:hypothetical protein J6590_000452 [Homalodisca vitripennis]|nr:hypothetical protein J6590_000452 [Homalodisca vitripennis]
MSNIRAFCRLTMEDRAKELAPSVRPLSGLQKRPARTFPVGYTAKGTCVPNFKFPALLEPTRSDAHSFSLQPLAFSLILRTCLDSTITAWHVPYRRKYQFENVSEPVTIIPRLHRQDEASIRGITNSIDR